MENFFHEGEFYRELGDMLEELGIEEDKVNELPEDWEVVCNESVKEPLFELSADWIAERINSERFTENEDEYQDVLDVLNKSIDFDLVNRRIPELFYETKNQFLITKADLISNLSK